MSENDSKEKGAAPKDDIDPSKVHSANCWETVDLGDDDRKKKFLRLMGASKKEHHGRFVIGDKEPEHPHMREKKETEEVNKELEEQYKHSHEHKITRYSHKGLGFETSDTPVDRTVDKDGDKNQEKTEKVSEHSESGKDSQEKSKKRESVEKPDDGETATPPKKPKMMMNFVKASD